MNPETPAMRARIARHFFWPWFSGYARGKLRSDPAYRTTFGFLEGSALPLLDIGCGMGLLAFYLHERGFRPPVLGIDVDEKKIARGARIAARHYPSVTLQVTDGGSLPEFLGHVTMLDVLHYLPPAQQKSTLQEMARRVAPGGWCVIRTTPRDGGWRFRCTLALEKFARSIAWMTRSAIEFPTIESVRAEFPETEFSSEIRPLWGRTPFNSWLLAFRRRN